MAGWTLPMEGGCRCGGVRVRVTAPPLLTGACHCRGCQRMSSSAFSLTVTVPAAGFAVVAGASVVGGLHGATQHHFCPHCMSWMFTRPEGMVDRFVNLRPTMLDDAGWFVPFVETYTSTMLPWARTGAARSYATFPEPAEYPGLIEAFAARFG